MPLYEYECTSCDHLFEVIQSFSDEPLKECTECGAEVKKLISAPAVQFKGTGWYVTDYGGRKSSESTSDSSSSKDSKESKSESSGEGKSKTEKTKVASGGGD
jgi:putative FmdB family regulatory protein